MGIIYVQRVGIYLDNHVCCCSSIVGDGDTVPFHDLVQGSKKSVPLLHFSCSLVRPSGEDSQTFSVSVCDA